MAIKAHGTGTRDNDLSEGSGFAEALWRKTSSGGFAERRSGAYTAGGLPALWKRLFGFLSAKKGGDPCSFGLPEELDPEIGFQPSPANTGRFPGVVRIFFTFFGFGGTCTSYLIIKE